MALVHLELQFVDESDNIKSCRFVQTMEQRLQRAFQDAERKVLNTTSKLNVQVKHFIFIKLLLCTTGEDQVLFLILLEGQYKYILLLPFIKRKFMIHMMT